MDSGAVHSLVLPKIVKKLGITPDGYSLVVAVANESKVGFLAKLEDIPVDHGGAIVQMDFFELDSLPFDIVIERPMIKRLGGVLDFHSIQVRFTIRGKIHASHDSGS